MTSPGGRPRTVRALLGWLLVSGVATAGLWVYRDHLDQAHMALAYLLVVLGASAREGRIVGIGTAAACFLAFDFFLVPPLYRFSIANPLELWVLLAFLVTSAVAAELFHRQQKALELAEDRALEIERLSEEARTVAALREAGRLKDALLATVSHDLRTPLTSIRATAAQMRAEGIEEAAVIEEEAERLGHFVSDLLDLSRMRAGGGSGDPQLNAAEDLVGAALERVRGLEGAGRIVVRMPPDGSIPVGRFDFVQALRALVNLIDNALRHSPAGAEVWVEVRRSESDLVFRVEDRGPGIDADLRSHLFEPFHPGPRSRGKGTGLGLAIAREAARLQGGDVEYRPRPGGGSVFTLRLPAEDVAGLE